MSKERRIEARKGFTLVEILIVMAILALLAAIVFPVAARAKEAGKRAVSISNLRQCGIALLIYCEELGGLEHMPRRPAADDTLAKAPTCDPNDYFRSDCSRSSFKPMIGSYAYVRDDSVYGDDEWWNWYLRVHEPSDYRPALLINLFASSERHVPSGWFGKYLGNPHPDKIQMFEADGGVRTYRPKSRPDIGFTWQTLFLCR